MGGKHVFALQSALVVRIARTTASAFDLLKAEALLVTKSMSKTDSHLDELASTIESAIIPRLLLSHGGGVP